VYRGDGRAVIRLAGPDLKINTTALQLIGDGLIRALTERIEGAAERPGRGRRPRSLVAG